MLKGQRESSNNLKSKTLPEFDCSLICAHDEVELHWPKARTSRLFFGMSAHCSGNTAATGMTRRHLPTIADVRTASALIGAQIVSAEHFTILLGDEDLIARCKPVCKRLIAIDVTRHCVRLSAAKNWLQNAPYQIGISFYC